MTAGRILVAGLGLTALSAGVAMWWLQVYAYYDELTPDEIGPVVLSPQDGGEPVPVAAEHLRAIDSESSPIRYRACFDVAESPEDLSARFVPYDDPRPPVAPRWFGCFDAAEIGAALEGGGARAFLGVANQPYGIDRVVAVLPDGRAFSWPQINECGEVVFDGDPPPEGCPPVPQRAE